jgi:uncharacterized protein with HEPN domain
MSEKDKANILAILDACDKISKYVEGISSAHQFFEEAIVFDATLMNFVVIGEMVDRISADVKKSHPDIDWRKIKDFRNIVSHDYLGIDAEEVWQIIHDHLPSLREKLIALLKEIR